MSRFTIVHMDDFERPFPKWALARRSLGLQSFGMNVVELPPGETIPEHDETGSDQEEVFIVLAGDAIMVHGFVNTAGRFENLAVIFPNGLAEARFLLHALQQWQFRPAIQNGQPTAVEVLLIIPDQAD